HRQVGDGVAAHGAADDSAGGVQLQRVLGHLNGLRDFARSELAIDASVNADLQRDILTLEGLETRCRGTNGVSARSQIGRDVLAGLVGGERARHARRGVRDGDRRTGDDAAALVGDSAENAAGIYLRRKIRAGDDSKSQKPKSPFFSRAYYEVD